MNFLSNLGEIDIRFICFSIPSKRICAFSALVEISSNRHPYGLFAICLSSCLTLQLPLIASPI